MSVSAGNVDMGITGLDIIAEHEATVTQLMEIGFGKCRLCLQAPIGKFAQASDLAGKRIVTSFPTLAKAYFKKFEDLAFPPTTIKFVLQCFSSSIALPPFFIALAFACTLHNHPLRNVSLFPSSLLCTGSFLAL